MLAPGDILQNRYTIQSTLGQGGFGPVYAAFDQRLSRQVALKGTFETSPDALRQFETEATLLARLRHPNLPTVSDHFVEVNEHYMVMDFIEGEDLGKRLVREHQLDEAMAVAIMLPVFDALQYLHSQTPPVYHRDIKPDNIRITPDNRVYLVDFGLAKSQANNGKTTKAARAVSPGFSPLEQYGLGTTDARSDLYAAGATLYALVTGYQPPEAPERAVNDRLAPLRQVVPMASPQLEVILGRLLAMNPMYRYPSAQAVITDLLAVNSSRLCPKCGTPARSTSRFCNHCGAPLVVGAAPQPVAYGGPTLAVSPATVPVGMQRFKPGDSQRFDTLRDSPTRRLLDGATVIAAGAWLLPWMGSTDGFWSGVTLRDAPYGFQYEVMVGLGAMVVLALLLLVRKQVAATRTALARWKLLLGIAGVLPALDIVLSYYFDKHGISTSTLYPGALIAAIAGVAITGAATMDIVGWRMPAAAFEPGYARVIRTAHMVTVGLLILCGFLTLLSGKVESHSVAVIMIIGGVVGLCAAASFWLPDRLPRAQTVAWSQP